MPNMKYEFILMCIILHIYYTGNILVIEKFTSKSFHIIYKK